MEKKVKRIIVQDFLKNLEKENDKSTNKLSIVFARPDYSFKKLLNNKQIEDYTVINILNGIDYSFQLEKFIDALNKDSFILVFVYNQIPQSLYNQIYNFAKDGFIDVNISGKPERVLKRASGKTNVILIGERKTLEGQYGNLLTLGNQFVDIEK